MLAHASISAYTASMPAANLDDLFAQTLQGDYDNDEAWEAIRTLRSIGSREVFDRAVGCCRSDEPLKRARGADILAQLGKTSENSANPFPGETFDVLTGMLESETDPAPLSALIAALGHLGNPAAIPLILPFGYHPHPDVRFDLAFALGCFADDERTVSTLIRLMTDKDSDVRDWATFGLGVLGDFDSPRIRESLFQNLSDADQDVREEAMVGLARRRDLRAVPVVINALQSREPSLEALDAANFLLERTADPLEDPSACLEAMHQRYPSPG